jgi:hypothetical protein
VETWVSGPVFMFCAPRLIFGGTEGVRSRLHVLPTHTHFRRHLGRWVPFSCFKLPDSFSAVSWASGPIFIFCAPELVFGGIVGVGSHFHVLLSWSRFRRYRGRRVHFSYFALPDSFSTIEGVRSCFHVLLSRTHFRRYRGRQVPFSYFALPNSFSAVPRASVAVFIFCAPKLIFGDTMGVRFLFHVLRS